MAKHRCEYYLEDERKKCKAEQEQRKRKCVLEELKMKKNRSGTSVYYIKNVNSVVSSIAL